MLPGWTDDVTSFASESRATVRYFDPSTTESHFPARVHKKQKTQSRVLSTRQSTAQFIHVHNSPCPQAQYFQTPCCAAPVEYQSTIVRYSYFSSFSQHTKVLLTGNMSRAMSLTY